MAQDESDRRDGEALRKLRAALPTGEWFITMQWAEWSVGGHGWSIGVQDGAAPEDDMARGYVSSMAPTLAEAADKARSALEATK